ncbi:hypothetical protein [Facklamia sp. 7083-14-GEN3]|uniref:hypothetical protein n=1 Tax=Facklamia sp. 7083-14-GEN3 TaxID=2973478 RepID=UPI00215CB4B2|nr:hypothetical protein [Facklamia sp. 7083-14-GEN3]MCR8968578.1 hypothetical protein [Facklamia sp. 7083-14-GEN3]
MFLGFEIMVKTVTIYAKDKEELPEDRVQSYIELHESIGNDIKLTPEQKRILENMPEQEQKYLEEGLSKPVEPDKELNSKAGFINPDADFYVVSYGIIEGYQLTDNEPEKVSEENTEIVKGQINPAVLRAELSNRYLVFSEEGPPHGEEGRIIAIDFKNGEIKYNQTSDYAYTSSGSSTDYYFTDPENGIAVFDTNLEEVSRYTFNDRIIGSDFSVDNDDNIYFLGVDIDGGDVTYPTYLYTLSFKDKKLKLENKEFLYDYQYPEISYYFEDSIVKDNQLYFVSPGYRIRSTKERAALGSILHYDMNTGQKELIDLPEIAAYNIFI